MCRFRSFFGTADAPEVEKGYVVRKDQRREIWASEGLVESLISPDLTDSFEVVHSVFSPKARLAKPKRRNTQEVGYVISGRLCVTIDGHKFEVGPGDSFRVRGEPYTWENPTDEPTTVIWVISPPVY